jgi:hypothetical protein
MSYATPINPKAYELTVDSGSGYELDNRIAYEGHIAKWVQIQNQGGSTVRVRLNDDPDCTFPLEGGYTQNLDTLHITSVDFAATTSGGDDVDMVVIAGWVRA